MIGHSARRVSNLFFKTAPWACLVLAALFLLQGRFSGTEVNSSKPVLKVSGSNLASEKSSFHHGESVARRIVEAGSYSDGGKKNEKEPLVDLGNYGVTKLPDGSQRLSRKALKALRKEFLPSEEKGEEEDDTKDVEDELAGKLDCQRDNGLWAHTPRGAMFGYRSHYPTGTFTIFESQNHEIS